MDTTHFVSFARVGRKLSGKSEKCASLYPLVGITNWGYEVNSILILVSDVMDIGGEGFQMRGFWLTLWFDKTWFS